MVNTVSTVFFVASRRARRHPTALVLQPRETPEAPAVVMTLKGSFLTDVSRPRPTVPIFPGTPRTPMSARTLAVLSAGLMRGSVSQRRRPPSFAWYHILQASHCLWQLRQMSPSSSCARQERSQDGIEGTGDGDRTPLLTDRAGEGCSVVAWTYLAREIGERGWKIGDCEIWGVGIVSTIDGVGAELESGMPDGYAPEYTRALENEDSESCSVKTRSDKERSMGP